MLKIPAKQNDPWASAARKRKVQKQCQLRRGGEEKAWEKRGKK